MGATYNLNEFAEATLNASGAATVFVAPGSYEKWTITRIAVTTTDPITSQNVPEANIFLDSPGAANFLEGTYSGNKDSSDTNIVLERNQRLYCQWSGGNSGSVATFSIFGERTTY